MWVSGVASGSPADDAGIEGGDIITSMEGVTLGADGTLADYCDVIRSHDGDAALSVEVLRFATGEVLRGQLNAEPLEVAATFGGDEDDDAGAEPEPAGDDAAGEPPPGATTPPPTRATTTSPTAATPG